MEQKLKNIFTSTECPLPEKLRQYVDGGLSPEEIRKIELHLASCEACSDEVEGMSILSKEKIDQAVSDLKLKIKKNITRDKNKTISTYLKIAAVLVLFAISGVLIYIVSHHDEAVKNDQISQNLQNPKEKEEKSSELNKTSNESAEKETKQDGLKNKSEKNAENNISTIATGKQEMPKKTFTGTTLEQTNQQSPVAENGLISENKLSDANRKTGKKSDEQNATNASGGVGFASGNGTMGVKEKVVSIDNIAQTIATKNTSITQEDDQRLLKKSESERAKAEADKTITKSDNESVNNLAEISGSEKTKGESKSNKNRNEPGFKQKSEEETQKNTESRLAANYSAKDAGDSDNKSKKKENKKNNNKDDKPSRSSKAEGASTGSDNSNAEEAYNQGNFKAAASLFEQQVEDSPGNLNAVLKCGISYYNMNNIQKAISKFESIVKRAESEFTEDARWYLALCYIKKDNPESAKIQLNEISRKSGKRKAEAEKKLLEINK